MVISPSRNSVRRWSGAKKPRSAAFCGRPTGGPQTVSSSALRNMTSAKDAAPQRFCPTNLKRSVKPASRTANSAEGCWEAAPLRWPNRHRGQYLCSENVGPSAETVQRSPVPFLLENPAYYITDLPSDPEIGNDMGLLDAIMQQSGCHLLLDLHNVYCNAVNHGC